MNSISNQIDMEDIRIRIQNAMDAKGLSMRHLSLKSGNAAGYVYSVLKDKKETSVVRLIKMCEVLDVSIYYIFLASSCRQRRRQ